MLFTSLMTEATVELIFIVPLNKCTTGFSPPLHSFKDLQNTTSKTG